MSRWKSISLALVGLGALAQTPVELEPIPVKAKQEKALVAEKGRQETVNQSEVTREGIANQGTPGQSNIWKELDLLPGVHSETADAFGFASRSPQNFRIRGQAGIGTSQMVEGIPVWGIETPGSRADLFDMENFQSVTLIRGAVPPDSGFGGGDLAGVLDMRKLKPADEFAITANQGFGSQNFLRTFARVDSGPFAGGTRAYLSFSDSSADKWKGSGGAPDYRHNLSLGLTRDLTPWLKSELYADYNEEKLHAFRALTYAQAMDLKDNENFDYNPTLTGTAAKDINYYDFNKERDRDFSLIGVFTATLPDSSTLTFKPYYFSEYRPAYSASSAIPGTSTPGIRLRTNDFTRKGGILEYKTRIAVTSLTAGCWYEVWNFPINETYYSISGNGALVPYSGEFNYKPVGLGKVASPYVRASTDLGPLKLDYGVRYFRMDNPGQNGYTATGSVDPSASYHSSVQDEWLPYAGFSLPVSPAWNLYANAGRNCARPQSYPEFMQTYISSRAAYSSAGIVMQNLVDAVKLETSDNYELGAHYTGSRGFLHPSLFYATYFNKLYNVWDPAARKTVKQSEGKSITYGAELEGGGQITDTLSGYASVSWIRSYLTDDLQTALNTFVPVKGNQTPDTPPIMAKLGLIYNLHGLEIAPDARYLDVRYGDSANTQRVPSYTVVDLNLDYRIKAVPHLKSLDVGMNVINLGDRRYIGLIGSFDDTLASSYLPGPRRAVAFHVGLKY